MEIRSHREMWCNRVHQNFPEVSISVLAKWTRKWILHICSRSKRLLHILAGLFENFLYTMLYSYYFVSYFLCGGFPFGRAVFLCEATRVFQPCCIIAGWAGSPWPGSNPTQKKTIIVYNVFLRWPFSFWA